MPLVLPLCEPRASTALTTSWPLTTSPKTTCLPSSHEVTMVVMKNCVRQSHHGNATNLRSVGVRARVRHREQEGLGVLELEVLVCELLAVDRLAAGSVVAGCVREKERTAQSRTEVTALEHCDPSATCKDLGSVLNCGITLRASATTFTSPRTGGSSSPCSRTACVSLDLYVPTDAILAGCLRASVLCTIDERTSSRKFLAVFGTTSS